MNLESNRLIIRGISSADKSSVFEYRRDKKSNKYQGWIPDTIDQVETFINKTARQIDEPGSWFQFVLIEKNSQVLIGDIGVHFQDTLNKQVEVGCTLSKSYWNKGYATEALRKVIDYLFCKLDKHRIIASIDPENTGSLRLVERIGFRKEAHFRQSYFTNGRWSDELIYALLKEEWPC